MLPYKYHWFCCCSFDLCFFFFFCERDGGRGAFIVCVLYSDNSKELDWIKFSFKFWKFHYESDRKLLRVAEFHFLDDYYKYRSKYCQFHVLFKLTPSVEQFKCGLQVQALRRGRQLKLEDVLNGLPNWLDRLVEGSIRRYYIPEWPDNIR